jgi:hypothetical protein
MKNMNFSELPWQQGVTKRCRLCWLTNSALSYTRPDAGKRGYGVSANENSCAHRAQINSIFNLCNLATSLLNTARVVPPRIGNTGFALDIVLTFKHNLYKHLHMFVAKNDDLRYKRYKSKEYLQDEEKLGLKKEEKICLFFLM